METPQWPCVGLYNNFQKIYFKFVCQFISLSHTTICIEFLQDLSKSPMQLMPSIRELFACLRLNQFWHCRTRIVMFYKLALQLVPSKIDIITLLVFNLMCQNKSFKETGPQLSLDALLPQDNKQLQDAPLPLRWIERNATLKMAALAKKAPPSSRTIQ